MAEDEATTRNDASVAVAERDEPSGASAPTTAGAPPAAPEAPAPTAAVGAQPAAPETLAAPAAEEPKKKNKKKKDEDEEPEYELEFATPFGKLEFEFEPVTSKEKRERRKREKAEQEAAKAAEKAEKRSAKKESAAAKGGRGGTILAILLIFAIIAAAIAIAVWLFARPGPEEAEEVPEEFRAPDMEPVAEQQAFLPKMRQRIGHAIRAGRSASREAQEAQERRFQDLTRGR